MSMNPSFLGKRVEQVGSKVEDYKQSVTHQLEELIDGINETKMAIVSVYKAVEAIAEKQKVELPDPLVDM